MLLVVTACGGDSGPDAPDVGATEVACNEVMCAEYPAGWDVEIGETFLSFSHPLAPQSVLATVGRVDMRGVVTGAGGTWPAAIESVVRDLWALLAGGEGAELSRVDLLSDGSVRSEGRIEGMRMWHRLIPIAPPRAIGVELRAPNTTWQAHADVFLDGVVSLAG